MLISRVQLLGANKRRFKEVPLPNGVELGDGHVTDNDSVRIRSLTAGEMDTFEASTWQTNKARDKVLIDTGAIEEHRRRLLRLVLVDESGNTLLTPDDDLAVVGIDGILVSEVYREACKHTGLKERDESIEKNSNGTSADGKRGS